MHKSKFINLLKTFSKEEFRNFGFFIQSPYFNRETTLISVFNIVKSDYPGFESDKINKKNVFKKLYPGKVYNDNLIRNLISDLLKLTELYLISVRQKAESFQSRYYLLKEITNRKQKILFETNFRKANELLKKNLIRDEIYYQHLFSLEDERRRNVVVNSSKVLYQDDNLNSQAKILNIQHLIENIKLYAIMYHQKKYTHDHNFDFTFFEIVTEYIKNNYNQFINIPYIIVFYNCVMLFKTEENKYFDALKKEMEKSYKSFSLTDRKNMFVVLTNHINTQIKYGNYDLIKERFEIYREFIRTKAYLEGNSFMAHYIYNAAAMSAIDIKEFEWAEKFILKYKSQLHIDFKEPVFNYCYANLYLQKENYKKALEHLSKVIPFDISFKLNVNISLLKIYFCLKETDAFYSLIDSFRHFLKRNIKLRRADVLFNTNFITVSKKLYNILISLKGIDRSEIKSLKKYVESLNNISSKKWILEEIGKVES